MTTRRACCLVLLSLGLAGAAPACKSTEPHERRVRDYQMPVELEQLETHHEVGSLWSANSTSNFLFTDQRAFRLGDTLTVSVEEMANAQRGASTNTSRETDYDASIDAFLGLMERLQDLDPNLDPSSLIAAHTSSTFDGSGQTGRSEMLEATVQVMVRQVLPNGNLFVEGHRVITVNNEEHYLYVSGVARPNDIDDQNVISSSRLAEAEIEFTGRGIVSDQQRPGVLARVLNWLWPF